MIDPVTDDEFIRAFHRAERARERAERVGPVARFIAKGIVIVLFSLVLFLVGTGLGALIGAVR